jgi:syntaxin 5
MCGCVRVVPAACTAGVCACSCRVAENIEDTVDNVTSGHNELLTHWQSVSSNWQLGLKVFLILILFIVLFVMFVL